MHGENHMDKILFMILQSLTLPLVKGKLCRYLTRLTRAYLERVLMKYGVLIGFIFALCTALQANADCVKNQYGAVVCGAGQCEKDQYGKVFCAPNGGGAVRDKGAIKCGAGYCEKDSQSQVWCSTQKGGSASRNSYGEVKCLGGCEVGSTELCEEAR
jgi:hypothetical protein